VPPKNKNKCISKEFKCKRDEFLLTWSSGSLFRPLKLLESTSLTKGIFLLLVDFQIAMVKMSYQLLFLGFFGPFCHFMDPPLSFFFLSWKLFDSFSEFLIGCYSTLFFWVGNVLGDESL